MTPIRVPFFIRIFYPGALWRVSTKNKVLYLTFDDGPIPEVTPWVLGILKKYDIKATFFCVGENITRFPDIYEQVIKDGHKVGNHTYNHIKGHTVSAKDYLENTKLAAKYIQTNLFRPPHGIIGYKQFKKLKNEYKIVMWDVLSRDYSKKITPEKCYIDVINNSRPGSIIVFHDSLKAKNNLEYTLPKAIEYFIKEGYRFDVIN